MLAKKIACLVLIISSLPLYGKNSYVKPESCTWIEAEHLHIQKIDNHELINELVFYLPGDGAWESMQNTWWDVSGWECAKSENCEPSVHARIRIQHISQSLSIPPKYRRIKAISGIFSIEFKDGRKLNGSFDANVRKPPKGMECE